MIIIKWDDNAKAYTDAQIDNIVDTIIAIEESEDTFVVRIGQNIIIGAIRLAIKTKRINFNHIKFIFDNEIIYPDINGSFRSYPKVLDVHIDIMDKLL